MNLIKLTSIGPISDKTVSDDVVSDHLISGNVIPSDATFLREVH